MDIYPEDRDPPEDDGHLAPEQEAGDAGHVELPAGQGDLTAGEHDPLLVDDEDYGENLGQVPVGVPSPQVTQPADPDCEGFFPNRNEEAEDEQDPGSLGDPSLV